jgi:hypothetical protein
VKHVGTLLADFRSDVESSRQSIPDRREMAANEGLGTRALQWVRQLEGLDETHILSKQFCHDLAWSLTAEDNDLELAKWMMEEGRDVVRSMEGRIGASHFKQLYHQDDRLGNQLRRRHDLFGGIIDGRLQLSIDNNANAALQLYCAIRNAAAKFNHGRWAFSHAGAEAALRGYLHTDRCAPCDSKLFDEFCDHLKDESIERQEEIVALKLYHPVSPDPCLALRHWKRKLE